MKDNFLILLVEDLRLKRHITQEDLTYGIIENKQYRKYLDGISKIPFKILLSLVNRLGIRFEDLMHYFYHYHFAETIKITELVNQISAYDFTNAQKNIDNIESKPLIQTDNVLMFDAAKLLHQYYSGKITKKSFSSNLLKLIDYQELLKKDALSIAEMYILCELMDTIDEHVKMPIAEKLNTLLFEQEYSNVNIPNFIIIRLIKYFSFFDQFDRAYQLCIQGIKNCLDRKSFYLLDYFYYCLSVCEHKLGHEKKRDLAILKCYSAILIDYSESIYQKFSNLFVKDYGKTLQQLCIEIIQRIDTKSI